MLRKALHGAKFLSPITKEFTHIVGFAFVDDTDLVSLDMTNEHITFEEVARDMQQAIDRWEGGLKTTGGAIVLEKSWIYAM